MGRSPRAKAPTSGRPIATDTRYAIPQHALTTHRLREVDGGAVRRQGDDGLDDDEEERSAGERDVEATPQLEQNDQRRRQPPRR